MLTCVIPSLQMEPRVPNKNQINDAKPRKLGRGLSALISQPVPVAAVPITTSPSNPPPPQVAPDSSGMVFVLVDRIEPNRFQPRRVFDQTSLERLADSIKSSGMMQPVILRRSSESGGGARYELVAGERRWRAASMAGLASVPSLIKELSDEQAAEWAIIENVQREDLNPMERAWAFRGLSERFGLTHQQVADRVGLDRSTVANIIRLTELEEPIHNMIQAGRLSAGHGKALLVAPPGSVRVKLAEQACDEFWSVRKLERAAAALAAPISSSGAESSKTRTIDLAKVASRTSLEKQLGEHLGTKVTLTTSRAGDRGRLTIEFYGLEHFDGLMAKFGFRPI